jgi:hypothetical protein
MKNRNKTKINQTLFEKLVKFYGLEKAEKIYKRFDRLNNNSTTYGSNL